MIASKKLKDSHREHRERKDENIEEDLHSLCSLHFLGVLCGYLFMLSDYNAARYTSLRLLRLENDAFILVTINFCRERFFKPQMAGVFHFFDCRLRLQPLPVDKTQPRK